MPSNGGAVKVKDMLESMQLRATQEQDLKDLLTMAGGMTDDYSVNPYLHAPNADHKPHKPVSRQKLTP